MCLLLDGAGQPWRTSQEDAFVVPPIFKAVEAGEISEAEFVDWVSSARGYGLGGTCGSPSP